MVGDGENLWRRCERAWGDWLEKDGWGITAIGAAESNNRRSSAPLSQVAGRMVRTPDLVATKQGVTEHWEVKSRARSTTARLTGEAQHWISYASFSDYLHYAVATGSRIWVILHESATSTNAARWLRIDVRVLRERGFRESKRDASGELVDAWVWPVSAMEVVRGPAVDMTLELEPLLPEESGAPAVSPVELAATERTLRRRRRKASVEGEGPVSSPISWESTHWLEEEPAVALEVLRRSLGVPAFPRYSVVKVGLDDVDVDDLLGLLHYGIRVFVVDSAPRRPTELEEQEIRAFEDARLLEWASELPEAAGQSAWIVDGQLPEGLSKEVRDAFHAADEQGKVNFAQYWVVHAPADADVMVRAGAGTGKTETMSERIIHLLAASGSVGDTVSELRADEIALVTFTRESAAEMRHRIARSLLLRQRLAPNCVQPVVAWMLQLAAADVATIHSLAKKVVAGTGGVLGFGPDFRVAKQTLEFRHAVQRALSDDLEELVRRHGSKVPAAQEWQRHVEDVWAALENNGVDLFAFATGVTNEVDWGSSAAGDLEKRAVELTKDVVLAVAQEMRALALRDQALPTNQLVPAATSALQRHPRPAAARYRYVFVDEFQDTDAAQMDFVLELRCQSQGHLFLVGDVKQGIYRFRGAHGNAFTQMQGRAEGQGVKFCVLPLSRNFRSGAALLDSLHPHFARWGRTSARVGREDPLLSYGPTDRLKARVDDRDPSSPMSVERVWHQKLFDSAAAGVESWYSNHPGESIGVLCRQNWQAIEVQRRVRALGLPCELRVGGSFFTSPAVRELRVLLEAVCDPADDAALLELCETRWAAGLLTGPVPLSVSAEKWGEALVPPADWAVRFGCLGDPGRDDFLREDLENLRRRIRLLTDGLRSSSALALVVELVRTWEPHTVEVPAEDDGTERERYDRCLDHLVTLLDAQFGDGAASAERLLAWLRLQIATNRKEDEPGVSTEGRVVALTVHKSKGIEFDRVLVPTTGTRFGPPRSVTTRTAVLRKPGEAPRMLFRWTPQLRSGHLTVDNVPTSALTDWAEDDAETLKEETRLLYVAMTRARKDLVLYSDPKTRATRRPTSWAELLEGGA